METIRNLHPLRVTQLSASFRRECEEYRRAADSQRLRIKREDGAELLVQSNNVSLQTWDGMSFDELQGMISRKMRGDQELHLFVRFWDGPRQIFQFDHGLAEMLAATEIGDVPWESLHFPYSEFYLHFGCVLDTILEIADRTYKAEGAYVRVQSGPSFISGFLPGAVHIAIATRLISPGYEEVLRTMEDAFSLKEPTYDITISGQKGETINEALARGRGAQLELARRHDEDALRSAVDLAIHYQIDPIGTANRNCLGLEEKKFLRGEAITTEALRLVFNCIAYLTAVPQESESEYPSDAPRSLIEKIKNASTPKKEHKLAAHMQSLGFTKVHFVKDPTPRDAGESIPTGKTVRTHWRRGHWRSQACGSGLTKRVLIWIRPCIVKGDKEDGEQATEGHIYKVAEEQQGAKTNHP